MEFLIRSCSSTENKRKQSASTGPRIGVVFNPLLELPISMTPVPKIIRFMLMLASSQVVDMVSWRFPCVLGSSIIFPWRSHHFPGAGHSPQLPSRHLHEFQIRVATHLSRKTFSGGARGNWRREGPSILRIGWCAHGIAKRYSHDAMIGCFILIG